MELNPRQKKATCSLAFFWRGFNSIPEILDLLLHDAPDCQWDTHLPVPLWYFIKLHLPPVICFSSFKSASSLEEKQLAFLTLISYTLQLLNVSITIYPTTYPWQ